MKNIIGIYEETVKNCTDTIANINNIIDTELLTDRQVNTLTNKFISLSPKKFGTFTECLTRHRYGFSSSENLSYDALSTDLEKIEIKSSRVILTIENDNAKNMFQSLNGLSTSLASFKDLFHGNFLCNIQQVKPTAFDQLYYTLFLDDVILEFKINSSDISNQLREQVTSCMLFVDDLKNFKHPESIHLYRKLTSIDAEDTVGIIKALAEHSSPKDKKLRDFIIKSELFEALYIRSKMGYSDKQHRGNSGEGQFHIKSNNIHYHLANNFTKAYTYSDFLNSLKSTPISKKRKTTQ